VPLLTVVFPAHNEERRIGPTLETYRQVCADADTEFVVALDHCTDGTERVVREHEERDPRVRVWRYPKLGKGGVIMEAFRRADAPLIAFVDADGATPPAELLRLVDAVKDGGADGAIASRWHPAAVLPHNRPVGRRIASAGFAAAVRRVFRLPYRDTQCGAKVFRRAAVERLLPLLSSRDFLFDVDLLVTARSLGLNVREVPTIWLDREDSKLQAGRDGRRMAASLVRLWLHHRVMPVHRTAAAPATDHRPASTDDRADLEAAGHVA
jgi:dolichol-phosphate mannosyltransferase